MPRRNRRTFGLPAVVSFEHPETMVIRLLQDALDATRGALNLAHAQGQLQNSHLTDLNQAERIAIVMLPCMMELNNLLEAYQQALAHQISLRQLAQLDLPF